MGHPRIADGPFLFWRRGNQKTNFPSIGLARCIGRDLRLRVTSINLLDGLGQLMVFWGNAVASVVGGERDVHAVPHVVPIGMVVEALGGKGHLCHERKRLNKVAELKSGVEGVFGSLEMGHMAWI